MSGKIMTMPTKPFLPPKPELQMLQRSRGSWIYPHFYRTVEGNLPVQLLQESFGDAEAAQNLSIALSGLSCSTGKGFPWLYPQITPGLEPCPGQGHLLCSQVGQLCTTAPGPGMEGIWEQQRKTHCRASPKGNILPNLIVSIISVSKKYRDLTAANSPCMDSSLAHTNKTSGEKCNK